VIKGFKEFLMRGNVIDLAVAVVIGTAFSSIVTAFTSHLINPIIALLGGANINGLSIQLGQTAKTTVDIGAIITAGINFVIVAAVVYFIFVLPMNKIKERRQRGLVPTPAELTELELLKEIRDLLASEREKARS
jgi:large conductance mechanosensitive channel